MIALDTQILVYAHREDSPFHERAESVVAELVQGAAPWAIPWPVLHEFLAVVTHPRIYRPASSTDQAFAFLESLTEAPGLRLLSEGPAHLAELEEIARAGKMSGAAFHDARIAALCVGHAVKELWSADRDFSRIRGLKVRNPLTT